jgi:DNA primase
MIDIKLILEKTDLIALAEEAGAQFNSSHSSRCPVHHGNNPSAFHVYRAQDGIQRYHCFTNCPEGANGGDAIAFYMRWRQVDFKMAVTELAQRAGVVNGNGQRLEVRPAKPAVRALIDQPDEPPCDAWCSRILAFVCWAQDELWKEHAQGARDYLMVDRGLDEKTIRNFYLGYNQHDLFDDSGKWGQNCSRVWCPRGIVIPHDHDGHVWFVNVRRPLPGDALAARIGAVKSLKEIKFAGVRGGKRGLFGIITGKPVVVLAEGEFDTMLAHQAASDFCDVATLGGARHRLDSHDAALLAGASIIVAILDDDEAGRRGTAYLASVTARCVTVLPPDHDLTDAWKRGVDLRKWLGGLVAQKMEGLMNGLHCDPPDDWLTFYQNALEAESR